ncbi:hypothetical protein FNV43_RR13740 [Rhamnella rubrinervis]|uniref:O-methyltransferase C-terminal domain-containing protein n=1 Tax=Rhamnella rubrinervis TaxID=2594499 RepID=A0A8K0MFK4_9ROSA|nr:hypothetical protein FNV43_RR13740 [Rhamnella rubrinervis]
MLSLSTWFKNSDKTVLETAHLTNIWYSTNPDTATNNSMFNEMMVIDSRLIATVMLRECKEVFEGVKSLVDVGGGTGTMAMAIANTFPHMKCTVLDLPNGVVSLQGTENLAFVAGDIFEAIPPANAILLKVHSLPNEQYITEPVLNPLNHLAHCSSNVDVGGSGMVGPERTLFRDSLSTFLQSLYKSCKPKDQLLEDS